jgi:hypothetical protein
MAEQIISPGVFTRENDLSFLPAGVGAIGAAIVGPTVKGPAFVPTVVNSFAEYERRFGPLSSETFVPQTVREYLRNAGSVTVTRVLGGAGYTFTNAVNSSLAVVATPSGSTNGVLLGVIFPSKSDEALPSLGKSILTNASTITGNLGTVTGTSYITSASVAGTMQLKLSGSGATTTTHDASIDPTSNKYWAKLLGTSPDNSKNGVITHTGNPGYTYINFKSLTTTVVGDADGSTYGEYGLDVIPQASGSIISVIPQDGTLIFEGLAQAEGYSYASTPWIISGKTTSEKQLFKVHTLNHGTSTNKDFKISISGLREPADVDGVEQYSSFNVSLRKYIDTDKSPFVLEQFNNVTLDPDSPQYIARVIGDRYPQFNDTLGKVELLGDYPNISNYVRIEVDQAIDMKSTSPKLSPKGFQAVYNPITLASFSTAVFPSSSYETIQNIGGVYNSKTHLGWKFEDKEFDNTNFILPLPKTTEKNAAGNFNVENYNGHASSSGWTGSLATKINITGTSGPTANQLKFSVPFQGGDDGLAPHTPIFKGNESSLHADYSDGSNLYGFDLSSTSGGGYKAYKKAIDIISNQDEYDINMLAIPGVIKSLHPLVTTAAIDMVEARGDAFYVMDLTEANSSVNTAVGDAEGIDTNYAAVYYPWVKVLDTAANKPVLVPPSVIVPGAIAASDAIAAEWFAPAGLNRGVLGNVIEAKTRLNQSERDILYDAKINPIATFPATGVCIWGQKTLQTRSTALDRINVRRLLIAVKKFIASSSRYLVFEQNTTTTRNRFLNIVNPYLESVQQRQGLYAFRVQMDEGNNTAAEIDRNQLVGAIYLQPTKTAEFIILDFNVLPTGATFDS